MAGDLISSFFVFAIIDNWYFDDSIYYYCSNEKIDFTRRYDIECAYEIHIVLHGKRDEKESMMKLHNHTYRWIKVLSCDITPGWMTQNMDHLCLWYFETHFTEC